MISFNLSPKTRSKKLHPDLNTSARFTVTSGQTNLFHYDPFLAHTSVIPRKRKKNNEISRTMLFLTRPSSVFFCHFPHSEKMLLVLMIPWRKEHVSNSICRHNFTSRLSIMHLCLFLLLRARSRDRRNRKREKHVF